MKRKSTRRALLTTVGTATTLTLAGCSSVLLSGKPGDGGAEKKQRTTDSGTKTPSSKPTGTETRKETTRPSARGPAVEDFEGEIGSSWRVESGKLTIDKTDPYQGSQSVVLMSGKKPKGTQTTASIVRTFYNSNQGTVDLRTHDLSMAVRFEKPVRGRIGVELIAPTESIGLTSRRFIPKELNGWTRIDLGYTGVQGKPVLKSVVGVRITVATPEDEIAVAVDDIRKIPKAKKGKVIFQFDDGHSTAFTEAFPRLKERNWPAGVAVIPPAVNTKENITWNQMRKMGNAGWDMMAHPPVAEPLPTLSAKKQEREIKQTKRTLELRGFEKGARHIVAPYGRVSNETIDILKKYYDANYIFGGCPNNAKRPSNMYGISRVFGTSPDEVKEILDIAERYNQLVVIAYHEIGGHSETAVSVKDFESVLNHVKKKDMDVVSPSQFLDS